MLGPRIAYSAYCGRFQLGSPFNYVYMVLCHPPDVKYFHVELRSYDEASMSAVKNFRILHAHTARRSLRYAFAKSENEESKRLRLISVATIMSFMYASSLA